MEEKRKDPKEKKCAICGKDMYAGEDWAYKRRIGGERTKWFCSYKCMRAWDAKHDGKNAKVVTADEVTAAPKEPTSRAVLAKALAKEIRAGRSVIEYMKAEGYKNPWEAYNAVRHYCETKMPELAEVLKPLRELQKAPAKTGRPEKPATVEKVEEVPPVQCIQHVTAAEIEEAVEAADANRASFEPQKLILRGGVDYQMKVDEAAKQEVATNQPGFRYEITSIMTDIGEFRYDSKNHMLSFTKKEQEQDDKYGFVRLPLTMTTREWDKLLIIVPQLADLMGVTL